MPSDEAATDGVASCSSIAIEPRPAAMLRSVEKRRDEDARYDRRHRRSQYFSWTARS